MAYANKIEYCSDASVNMAVKDVLWSIDIITNIDWAYNLNG